MGRYDHDPRVVREHADHYRLPDPDLGDDWHIRRNGGTGAGWRAVSEHGQAAMDPTDRYHRRRLAFDTADDAIGHIIGDPIDRRVPAPVAEAAARLLDEQWQP